MNKRLVFFLILSFSFFLSPKVFALNPNAWVPTHSPDFSNTQILDKVNGTSSIKVSEVTYSGNLSSFVEEIYGLRWTSSKANNVLAFVTPQILPDYLYSVSFYLCTTKATTVSMSADDVYVGTNATNGVSPVYSYFSSNVLSKNATHLAYSGSTQFNSCIRYNFTFSPKTEGTWIQFVLHNTSTSNEYDYFGFDFEVLGIYTGYFDELLNSVSKILENLNSTKEEIIDNQNYNSQKEMENQDENTDKVLNADSDSSFKGDNGSTSNYNQAESELMDSIDVDVDSIDMDLSPFLNPFKWIWEQVDKLLNLNSKIFSTVITLLTFGFVGLVINRG